MGIFNKDYVVGLDIGASSVKAALFESKGDTPKFIRSAQRELKKRSDGKVPEDSIVSAVKSLAKELDFNKARMNVSINCPMTAIKIVRVPYMPKSELKDAISLASKSYFPFSIEHSNLDYEIMGDFVDKGARVYEVAVAVSPEATVSRFLSLLHKAGIKPASFISCPYAIKKLAEKSYAKKEKTTCLLDMGELHAELVILRGKELVFSRKIPVKGEDFTKALTEALVTASGRVELTQEEAEKIKKEIGIPPEGEQKIIDGKISTSQISSLITSPLENLAGEIERCFDYYREETGGGTIDSLVLLGGGALLKGLPERLAKDLGIEVKLGEASRFAAATGAALSGYGGVNLLPEEIKEETKGIIKRSSVTAAVVAVVITALLFYIGMKIQLGNLEKRIEVGKLEITSLSPQLRNAHEKHLANLVLVNEPHWEDIFRELSNILPIDIHLKSMQMKNGVITLKGVVEAANGEEIISRFIVALEDGIFRDVKLIMTRDLDGFQGNEFEIRCVAE